MPEEQRFERLFDLLVSPVFAENVSWVLVPLDVKEAEDAGSLGFSDAMA